jgi:phenylalanyl-tRNA synthetase beta chain
VLGAFGELHPAVIEALDARPPLAGFEVFLDAVPEPRAARAKPPVHLSVFQPIERDFAFVVERDLPAETLFRAARGVDRKLVSEIRLFDLYEGAGLPEGKKSLAITVVLQPQERTLTDAEIEGFSEASDHSGRKSHWRVVARLTKRAVIPPGRLRILPCLRAESRGKNRIGAALSQI